MYMNTIVATLAAAAGLASAAPTEPQLMPRQSSSGVNFVKACEEFRPGPDELGLLAIGGTTVEWDGDNLGNGSADKIAVLYDSDCNIIESAEWRPQNPTFAIRWDWANGLRILARTAWIGAGQIGEMAFWVDEEPVDYVLCGDFKTTLDGINAGYYRSCNFQHLGKWPPRD